MRKRDNKGQFLIGQGKNGKNFNCLVCDTKFYRSGWNIKNGRTSYCSVKCQYEGYRKQVELKCEQCEKDFIVREYRKDSAKFCSRSCASRWQGLRRKWSKETRKKIGNAHRGKKLTQKQREQISISLLGKTGELARNWQGGLTELNGNRPPTENWRNKILERDGYRCKIGNDDCSGRLEAHHILDWVNYPELRFEINNGITLCSAHHPRGRANEAKLAPVLQGIVASYAN